MNRLTDESVLDDENIKFVEDKLEYADKMKAIEEELGCPLDVAIKKMIDIIYSHQGADCKMCINSMRSKTGCDGNCKVPNYTKMELIKKWLKEDRSE